VTDDAGEARRRLAHYVAEYAPRPASSHAFAREGGEEPYAEVPIDDLARDLRFRGKHDRLTLADGHVDPRQLRAMRRLTFESAALLLRRWEEHRGLLAAGRGTW
jgi:hypothetical protein